MNYFCSTKCLLLILCVLFVLTSVVQGHARWKYPTARTSDSGLKSYPCGGIEFFASGHPVTTLQPGKQILQFEETISHRGAPFRIALSIGSDSNYDDYILISHIPHNDASETNPVKVYQYEVTIPDIDCPKCSLALTNPMTDKITSGTCCSYPKASASSPQCLSVYHSCANVVIKGKIPVDQFKANYTYTGPCGDYTQESSTWVRQTDESWKLSSTFTNYYIPPASQRCPIFNATCATGANRVSTSTRVNSADHSLSLRVGMFVGCLIGVISLISLF